MPCVLSSNHAVCISQHQMTASIILHANTQHGTWLIIQVQLPVAHHSIRGVYHFNWSGVAASIQAL